MSTTSVHIGEEIQVLDKNKKGPYQCTVIDIDQNEGKVQIHWTGCNKKSDEWIDLTSTRIVEAKSKNSKDPEFIAALDQVSKIDAVVDKIVKYYDPDISIDANEENLYKAFPVGTIKECAESLKLATLGDGGKKLLKAQMIKNIVTKIRSMLPMECSDCQSKYKLAMDEKPLVSCFLCERPSHNCQRFEGIKQSLPLLIELGFRWVCDNCENYVPSQKKAPAEEDEVYSDSVMNILEKNNPTKPSVHNNNNDLSRHDNRAVQNNLPICKHYRKGNCPHGLRGKKEINGSKCKFQHPKPCK